MSLLMTRAGPPPGWMPTDVSGLAISLLVALMRQRGLLWQNLGETVQAVADLHPVRVAVCPFTGRRWTAPSDAARPRLWDVGAGKWRILFDGVDDVLDAGDLSAVVSAEGCVGIRFLDPGGPSDILRLGQTRSNDSYERYIDTKSYPGWLRTNRVEEVLPAVQPGLHTMLVRSSAARWARRVDGVTDLTAAAGFGSANDVKIGGTGGGSPSFLTGSVAGELLYGVDPSDADTVKIEAYLNSL